MDVLLWLSEKVSMRSRQDQEAINCLDAKTQWVEVDGINRYTIPLFHVQNFPQLCAPKEAVHPQLRAQSTERRLSKAPETPAAYITEIQRLEKAGYVIKMEPAAEDSQTSWYIPHHMVEHNGKHRVVLNGSFQFQGVDLNKLLLPGPTLAPSLLAVLLCFREHAVTVTSDICGMFHQVRLLPPFSLERPQT